MMNRADAAAILQISPTASAEEARRAYQELFTEHQVRLTNAPTPALRNLYQARLRELDEARDAMSSETSADDIDLPLAEPKLPGGAATSWRSGDAASPPSPPAEKRTEASIPPSPRTESPKSTPPALKRDPAIAATVLDAEKPLVSGNSRKPVKKSRSGPIVAAAIVLLAIVGYFVFRRTETTRGASGAFTRADTAMARSRARWIWVRINSGEKFEDIARKESDDSATAPSGGDLGAGAQARFGPEFEKVASAITVPGTTAQPVLDSLGYDLIRLDRRTGNTLSLHRILIRIRHTDNQDLSLVRQQLKENLAIAKTEFGRGEYDNADRALSAAEAFTYQMPEHLAEDSVVAPMKAQLDEIRTRVDRACYAEDQIARQRSEAPPCKYLAVPGIQRGWTR